MLDGRRIIFVLGNLELGGAERQALILAKYLSRHERARVQVLGFNKMGPVAEICAQHGLTSQVIPYPSTGSRWRRRRALARVALCLRKMKPDLILPYTLGPNVVCGLTWRWTGARSCVWNQRDEGLMPAVSASVRRAANATPRFVANSEAGAKFLIAKLAVDPRKISVIPNGIEVLTPEADRREWRARLAVDEKTFVACMVANLHLNKDHATVLRAWPRVVKEFSTNGRSPLLVFAGRHDGAYETLTALASDLRIGDTVRFVGPVSDVGGLLAAADVSVFSSVSEGCPNAVLESMAAGLAVAGSDIPAIREVVGANGCQFLAPAGDADSLASILLKMAQDQELCRRIGSENRERVKNRYDSLRMCGEMSALLARLL